eukprot:753612-Rhodomonas_salina.2
MRVLGRAGCPPGKGGRARRNWWREEEKAINHLQPLHPYTRIPKCILYARGNEQTITSLAFIPTLSPTAMRDFSAHGYMRECSGCKLLSVMSDRYT